MPEYTSEEHRNIAFSNSVTMTLRQEPGFYETLAGTGADYTGDAKARITNRFGRIKMQPRTVRNGDTDNTDLNSLTRWIKPGLEHTVAPLLDRQEFQETMIELGAPAVNEVAYAARTYHDDMCMAGIFGNGYTGDGGDTAVPFKSANIIPHGSTGFTKQKLLDLKEMIRKRNAPLMREQPIILLHPEDEEDMFLIDEYVNMDYTGGRALETGELKPWLGFRFMVINPDEESLPTSYSSFFTDGGSTRNCPVVFPSGLHRGTWVEFDGRVTQRDDKNFSTQFWGAARSACVRTDEDLFYIVRTQ